MSIIDRGAIAGFLPALRQTFQGWTIDWLLRVSTPVLLAAFLVNLAQLAFSIYLGTGRPIANLDLFVAAVLIVHPWRVMKLGGVALVAGAAVYEVYRYIAGVFLFDISSIIEVFGFIHLWPWKVIIRYLVYIVFCTILIYFIVKRVPRKVSSSWIVLGPLALGIVLDGASGANGLGRLIGREYAYAEQKLVFSSGNRLAALTVEYLKRPQEPGPIIHNPSTDLAREFAGTGDVLVVVAEAMGVFANDSDQKSFERDISQALAGTGLVRFTVEASHGNTIDGEVRVLCGRGKGNIDLNISGTDCLPKYFSERGYETLARHGFDAGFYKRDSRYPRFGFNGIRFRENAPRRVCEGAFQSLCDADLLRELMQSRANAGRSFLYLMTIETHLPMPACRHARDDIGRYRCNHLRFFESLGAELRKARGPIRVIVVGDHPPPFQSEKARSHFESDAVGIVIVDHGLPRS